MNKKFRSPRSLYLTRLAAWDKRTWNHDSLKSTEAEAYLCRDTSVEDVPGFKKGHQTWGFLGMFPNDGKFQINFVKEFLRKNSFVSGAPIRVTWQTPSLSIGCGEFCWSLVERCLNFHSKLTTVALRNTQLCTQRWLWGEGYTGYPVSLTTSEGSRK